MHNEEKLLVHSPSDESLFDDLKNVVTAPREMLSHLVGSRTKEDREELGRILTHLPAIRECRAARALKKTTKKKAEPADILSARRTAGSAKESAAQGITPRGSITPRSSRAAPPLPPPAVSPSVPATPRGTTPRAAATPRGTTPGAAAYVPLATPRGLTTPLSSRGSTPRMTGAAVVRQSPSPLDLAAALLHGGGDGADEKAAMQKAIALRGDKTVRKPEDEKKSQAEATQRVIEKLAELGIDPEGMSATDILRIFYARGSGSSYWLANREAEKRLNIRCSTPKSFAGVLMPRAEREIRRARDLPVTNVHEYLDQWEIAFLGDICRSLRCFDEAAEGNSSEYMNKFTRRQYGAHSGRKKHIRPET